MSEDRASAATVMSLTEPLQDFDTSKLIDSSFRPCVTTVIGSRRSGKTTLMQSLVEKVAGKRANDKVVVFSSTSTDELSWPPSTVFVDGFKEDVVCSLLAEQKAALETTGFAPRLVVVFDDVSHEFKNAKCIADLIFNGRHFNTAVMISMQCDLDLLGWIRSSTDFTFYFPQHLASRKPVYHHYFSQVQTLVHFDDMCKQLKTNEALVSDSYDYVTSQRPVTKYRAEYNPPCKPQPAVKVNGVVVEPTTLLATVQALQENDTRARVLSEKRAALMQLLSQYAHSEFMQHANMHQELSEQLCAQQQLTKSATAEAEAAGAKLADVISKLQAVLPAAL